MKAKKHLNLATTTEITSVVGMSRQNINDSYINNKKKEKMTTALIYGTFMMLENITPDEMILAKKLIIAKRKSDEEIKGLNAG